MGQRIRASKILGSIVAGVAALSLVACSSSDGGAGANGNGNANGSSDGATAEIAGLLKQGELSVCTIDYYPPMEYLDDNDKLTGFDVDMIDAVGEKLGVDVRYVVMRFEGLLPGLDTERCDIASAAMYLNEDRQAAADPIPYMETTAQLMVAAGNPKNMKTLDDLSGKVMAIDAGTSNLAIAEDLSNQLVEKGLAPMDILQFPAAPDTFQQIRVGRADGVIESDVVVGWLASQEPDKLEYVRFQDEADGTFAVYAKKGSGVDQVISDALKSLFEDGTLYEIADRYGLDKVNLDNVLGK